MDGRVALDVHIVSPLNASKEHVVPDKDDCFWLIAIIKLIEYYVREIIGFFVFMQHASS